MRSLQVNSIKDFSIAPDNKLASFTLVTKYAGDLGISVPIECLKILQAPSDPAAASAAPQPQGAARPASSAPQPPAAARPAAKPGEFTVALTNKWVLAADQKHGVVAVLSNLGSPTQTGLALRPKDARELATALLKQAAVLEAAEPPQT